MIPSSQHCDHEPVCLILAEDPNETKPCDFTGCKHDTRSRPSPAPTSIKNKECSAFQNENANSINIFADEALRSRPSPAPAEKDPPGTQYDSGSGHGWTKIPPKCSDDADPALAATQETAMRMYSLMLEVKQNNTGEFMEYYEQRMREFQSALGIRTPSAPQEDRR